ncbi:MAG: porin family protein [Nitrosomonadales bacterium]|nr:porin family protein [Nitrosomonadales bacterium]
MKKFAAVVLLSVVATPVFAADEGFYAGINVGRTTSNITVVGAAVDDKANVAGILAGYQYNKNLAVEVEYTGAGKFNTTPAALTGKTDALSLSAVGILPMSEAFSVYGKLGVARTSTTASSTPVGVTGKSRTGLTYGLGLQYNVTPAVGIRAGYDRYDSEITGTGVVAGKFSNNKWSVGAVFKF